MRLLVLAVDRDDDLGRKTGIKGPVVGRQAVLDAANALILADPEEADANGFFAAVQEYDKISKDPAEYGADGVDVAIVTGDVHVGSKSDTILTRQFEMVEQLVHCQGIVLVSDGAEDEHLLPLLTSRVRVSGVRRVIIKQAKNLEGFVYMFQRLMTDEKLQRRFFLPLAFLLFAAAISVFSLRPEWFISAALALAAFYILVQVFSWQEPIGDFFTRVADEIRAGKLSLVASIVSLAFVVVAGYRTVQTAELRQSGSVFIYAILFIHGIFWWVVAAVLVSLAGRAMDQWLRKRVIPHRQWEIMIFFLAGSVLASAAVAVGVDWARTGTTRSVTALDTLTNVFFAGFLFFSGLIALRYFHSLRSTQAQQAGNASREISK